jgi:hypothetical protein
MSLIKKINDPSGKVYDDISVGSLTFDTEPIPGSFNAVTSDGIFKALGGCSSVEEKLKVIAAALNDLNARLAAIESAVADNNIGSVIADSIDTQTLLVGGSDLEARVAAIEAVLTNNNLRTAAAPAASFTKSVSVDNLDLQVEDKTEVTETKKAIEDNIMEEK